MEIFVKHIFKIIDNKTIKSDFFVIRENQVVEIEDICNSVFESLDEISMEFEAHFFFNLKEDDILFKIDSTFLSKKGKLSRNVVFNSEEDMKNYSELIENSLDVELPNIFLEVNFSVADLIIPVTEKMKSTYKDL